MLDPEEGGRFGIGSNGTGPFTLAEFRVGERALLRAHEGAGRRAKLDELLLLDLGDEAAACAAALESGQDDGLARCDYSVAESLAGRPGLQVNRLRSAATCLPQDRKSKRLTSSP